MYIREKDEEIWIRAENLVKDGSSLSQLATESLKKEVLRMEEKFNDLMEEGFEMQEFVFHKSGLRDAYMVEFDPIKGVGLDASDEVIISLDGFL